MVDVALPEQVQPPEGSALTVWVIYDRPADAPHACVLRPQFAMRDGRILISNIAWYSASIDELRSILPPGVTRLPRQADDDPKIVETWI